MTGKHLNPTEDPNMIATVWRIVESSYEGEFTVGIFSTKEKADAYFEAVAEYRHSRGWEPPQDWSVEEYELDPEWPDGDLP